ncbi:hypothetical protein ES288_D07G254300v1 [Gossypium darwinii]|uniref:DUF4378 domain-containing protein n=1 Tax=Gossypium darwinii TaxID=34276 RepID=A0A5D2C1N3_GOSDA|nr:hypothetical protein ES288_D07G254300v1 [Gossypium darwinii]
MTTGIMQEQNLEEQIWKQMGCMAGFLQIFDRHLYSTKRLRPSPASETTSEEEKAIESPVSSRELEKRPQSRLAPSPERSKRSPVISELRSPAPEPSTPTESQNKTSLLLPIFESKEGGARSPWKLSKDAPRLSLDSRAIADATGSLKPWEIRTNQCKSNSEENGADDNNKQRKCFFDSADFFPEPKQTDSIYGEIEKRLKRRGIDEPAKDLETLKKILEALQLKGLLHNKKPPNQTNKRNFVYEHEQSPLPIIKQVRSPASAVRRIGNDSPPSSNRSRPGPHRNLSIDVPPVMSPRRDRLGNEGNQSKRRGSISPTKSECGVRSPNRRPLSVQTQRRGNANVEQRRVSLVQSPRVNVGKIGLDQTTNRSSSNRRPTAEIYQKEEKVIFIPAEDETSTVSESSISTSSQTDTERSKVEEYKDGRSLLERCDKLLHSIAEMVATTELQSSPVSVLDSSFYKDESSVSPVKKRSIDFKDDTWSPAAISSDDSKSVDKSNVCDFIYIFDILRASNYLIDDSDVFLLLEKQQHLKGKDTSKVSRLQRKLIFDTINEILNRKRQLPAWKLVSSTKSGCGEQPSLRQIWSEFQKIRERDSSDDLFGVICSVLRKDLAGDAINGWGDYPIEMSESVLNIERVIFEDLIVETIWDLAAAFGKSNKIRRQLVF